MELIANGEEIILLACYCQYLPNDETEKQVDKIIEKIEAEIGDIFEYGKKKGWIE